MLYAGAFVAFHHIRSFLLNVFVRSPTTFWITNPIVNVRNNAAAGGQVS